MNDLSKNNRHLKSRQSESVPFSPPPTETISGRTLDRNSSDISDSLTSQDEMEAILSISLSLAGKLELPLVLGAALDMVGKLIGAEGASILLIDPNTGGMEFYITEGPGAQIAKTIPLPPKAGICGYVAQNGQSLIINDAQHDPRLYRQVDQSTGMTTRNILCVPIQSGEKLWGVLELINKNQGRDFSQRDLRLSEIVATQIGLALENSHLHKQIVQKERMAAIGQTVSGLAHCIKNILNGIRSGSAVIDRAMSADDFNRVSQGWQTVRRNNEMLGTLVLDMLALARDSKPHPFPTDVNDLAKQVCELMTERAAEKQVNIKFMPHSSLPDVTLDPTHFYRCLLNLVSNALDACETNGNISVRLFRGNDRTRFTVSITDSGEGISQENQRKLFEEFFTTKGGRGTGLGLPVTKKLIKEMGGIIIFHSIVGRGTRFVIALPINDTTKAEQET
ncbi:MAG: HAMP domain-containing histidine kinase [Sedimentisphaerales bacterium]|nr:HAMP domain-containing histidine kinase [Sedimentisphaerales bacterium]